MTYQQFFERNEINKMHYKQLVKQNGGTANLSPYLCCSIEKADLKHGNGVIELSSKIYQNEHTTINMSDMLGTIFGDYHTHVTNPSRIKNWSGFAYN